MYRIFIVEDDAAIAQAVCEQAESWALEARCVSDFRRVAEEAAAYGPHLILLDISLPFFDGYHWCRQIRRTRNELSRTFYQKNKQQYYLLHYACCVCHLAV